MGNQLLFSKNGQILFIVLCVSIDLILWTSISLQSSAYLQCCTKDFMDPEPAVCGKNITDFPGFDDGTLTPEQEQQLNDVRRNSVYTPRKNSF